MRRTNRRILQSASCRRQRHKTWRAEDLESRILMTADVEHCATHGLPQSSLVEAMLASASSAPSQTPADQSAPQDLSPNLVVTALTAPATFTANTATNISWTVTNQGDAAADADFWYDYVFLSVDAIYDPQDFYVSSTPHDQQLGQSLAAGSDYSNSMNITLPGQADAGSYYLILVTDLGEQQSESDDTDNARAVPITLQAPDLAVTEASAPPSAILGGSVNVSWTVTNQSALPANAQYFYDYFYLSADAVFDEGDTLVDSAFHTEPNNQPLAAGAHYTEARSIRLASGSVDDHYLLIVANAGNSQSESTRANNVAALSIALSAPDLKITAATAPNAASVSQTISIGWDVQNQSGVIAPGIWQDAIYLSSDAVLDGTDSYLTTETFTGAPLGPGQTYHQNAFVTLPQNAVGQYYLLINVAAFEQPDTDTSNNLIALPITLTAPDLVVSAATAPATGVLGSNINISFTVTNQGAAAAAAATWNDYIYLSKDNVLDFNDSFIGFASAQPDLPLAAGASYTRNLSAPLTFSDPFGGAAIPQEIGEQAVTYYLLFTADATAQQGETDETNNLRAVSIELQGSDIIVQSATPPAAIKAGVTFPLSWTVKNQGDAATNVQWYDAVYLSDDATYSNNDKFLDLRYTTTDVPLAAGATYTATQNFVLPANTAPGSKYLIIRGDAFSYQSELDETNNDLIVPISITVPDVNLEFTAASGPAGGVVGSQVAISYTVTNSGTEQAGQSWIDQFYLSVDATLDASDTSLGSTARSAPLAAAASYTVNRNLVIPNNVGAGNYYLLLAADRNNTQAEIDETDNTQALPITISGPDMTVTALTGPTSAVANTSITVNWTVQNDGNTTTTQNWSDAIYLTSNPNSDGSLLTTVNVQTSLPLTAGAHYDKSTTVTLPNQTGSLYLVVRANPFNQQAETNTGNNRRVIPIQIDAAAADLSISDLTVPAIVTAGETVAISWKVSNIGAASATTDWFDHIYLSDDATYGPGDEFVSTQSIAAQTPLAANASYTINRNLTIPSQSGHAGPRYLLVIANFNEAQSESTRANNVIAVPIDVLVPDLSVTSVTAPPSGGFGEVVPISFTVKNNGTGAGLGIWYDRVYVSTDPVYDGSDTWVADFQAPPSVAAGSSYTVNQNITIPATTTGQRYLVIVSDYANTQIESDETNNEASASFGVDSVDLRIDSVDAPATPLTYGQPFNVSWTVTNLGTVAATQNWKDRVYLSADGTLGPGDIFIGERSSAGDIPLSSNGSYTATLSVTAPIDVGNLPGDFRILVAVDDSQDQPELSEANNKLASSIVQFELALLPDLVSTNLSAPVDIFTLQPFTLRWTDRNQGDTPAVGPWGDRVFISTESVFNPHTAAYYGQFDFPGTLNPGEEIERAQEFTLPDVPGDYWVFIVTDSQGQVVEGPAETNNVPAGLPIHVTTGYRPDLIVSDITVPATTVLTGSTVAIAYTITNVGTAPTAVPAWYDVIFLDQDPNVDYDIGDNGLGVYLYDHFVPIPAVSKPNGSFLDVGQSYTQTVEFTLRDDRFGPWYAYVAADGYPLSKAATSGQLVELDGLNNLVRSAAFNVDLAPPPDLQVTVNAPDQAFSGQDVALSWTVSNEGTGRTPESSLQDNVYLSLDNVLDASDVLLDTVRHTQSLNPLASSTLQTTAQLPIGIQGDYFILVRTDALDEVYEHSFELNNDGADPIHINLTPPPDLEVTSLNVPAGAMASHTISFTYTVANNGSTATPNTSWKDAFYLSSDNQLSLANDIPLVARIASGPLAVGGAYTVTIAATIPDGTDGDYYLLAATDSLNVVFELDNANNIVASAAPIDIVSQPADLVITSILAPTSVVAGAAVEFEWTEKNQGAGDTAIDQWKTKFYLSTDNTIGQDVLVGAFSPFGILDPGAEVTHRGVFTIPPQLVGAFKLYAVVDAPLTQFEDGVDPTEETGLGGQVYEAGQEGNNASSLVDIEVVRNTADLVVASVGISADPATGQTATVTWSVENQGSGETNANYWYDDVYLSTDDQVGSDTYLGSLLRSGKVAANESYTAALVVTLPATLAAGDYRILVRTDRPVEPSFHQGFVNRVFEAPGEDNNETFSAPFGVLLSAVPDLAVTQVAAPDLTYSGRALDVSWTVSNQGATTGPITWFDVVYLSLDTTFDPNADRSLGFVEHPGGLAAGGSYQQTTSFPIPAGVAGRYYVFVATDRGNRVFERDAEGNNASYDAGIMDVPLAAPVDLVAGQIVVPINAVPGQNATITYTVHNAGAVVAVGGWTDKLYLSSDTTWDLGDALFSSVVNSDAVAAGGNYSKTVTAPLPGVLPGSYYLIVRSDILNNVLETDESNNLSASLDSTSLDAEQLVLGTPKSGVLGAGQSIYYRIETAANQTVRLHFDSQSSTASNELYVSFGTMPRRGNAQFNNPAPFSADQEILIPQTQAGVYYVLVYGDDVAGLPPAYTISAEVVPFSVSSVDPPVASNMGDTTLRFTGARFSAATQFELIAPDGEVIPNYRLSLESPTVASATFGLAALTPGFYDVVARDGSNTITLSDELQIVDNQFAVLEARIVGPDAVIIDRTSVLNIEYENVGVADSPSPLLILESRSNSPSGLQKNGQRSGPMQLLGIGFEGYQDTLRPGAKYRIPVYFTADTFELNYSVRALAQDNPYPLEDEDWQEIELAIRPDGLSDAEWTDYFARIRPRLGDTWGDYATIVSRLATQLNAPGERLFDVREIFRRLYALDPNAVPTQNVSGQLLDSLAGTPLANVELNIYMYRGTMPILSGMAQTDAQGNFNFAGLLPGKYAFDVPGNQFDMDRNGKIEAGLPLQDVTPSGDVAGVKLYALTPQTEVISDDQDAQMAVDAVGRTHIVWTRNGEVWHARYEGGAWVDAAKVADGPAYHVRIQASSNLIDGATPGLMIVWEQGIDNQAEIYYSAAVEDTPGHFKWSLATQLTSNAISDGLPTVVLTDAGKALVAYGSIDSSIQDDADLYYKLLSVVQSQLTYASVTPDVAVDPQTGAGGGSARFAFGQEFKLFKFKGFQIAAKLQISGQYTILSKSPPAVAIDSTGSGEFSWENAQEKTSQTNDIRVQITWQGKRCKPFDIYNDFKQGTFSWAPGIKIEWKNGLLTVLQAIPSPQTQALADALIFMEWGAALFDEEMDFGLFAAGQGRLKGTWYDTPPVPWRDPQYSTNEFLFRAGPYIKTKGPLGDSKTTADLTVRIDLRPTFGFKQVTGNIEFEVKDKDGFYRKQRFRVGWFLPSQNGTVDAGSESIELQDVNENFFENETEFGYDPSKAIGTGNVYGSSSVVADVASDLRGDGVQSMAKLADGSVFMAWTKDRDTQIGDEVATSFFDGTQWSAPQFVPGSLGLSGNVAAGVDALNRPIVVWPTASAAGLDATTTEAELNDAEAASNLMYSIYENGSWSLPALLSATPGADSGVALGRSLDGTLTAAWVERLSAGQTALRTAQWDGTTWSALETIDSAEAITGIAVGQADGQPTIFWTRSGGDAQSRGDHRLYFSRQSGDWSQPALFDPALAATLSLADSSSPSATVVAPQDSSFDNALDTPEGLDQDDCDCEPKKKPKDKPNDGKPNNGGGDDYNPPVRRSHDPNDIVGPTGFGDEAWLTSAAPLTYTVLFENVATATAAAAEVKVSLQLDEDLDFRTFRVDDFGFGPLDFDLPGNQPFVSRRIDLTQSRGIYVDVTGSVDVQTGLANWTFKTIDPLTGDVPNSVLGGFLPPNDASGAGQGYVSFSVRPKANIATGTVIAESARIIFDTNEPIDTPLWKNTLDVDRPVSNVAALPTQTGDATFDVSWQGNDASSGSGLAGYNLYVARDDQPFELWLARTTLTSAPFVGDAGHSYAFFSVAVDNAGNFEALPTTPDALTATPGAVATIGDRAWVDLNANGLQDLDEPGLANAVVLLLDASGTQLATTTTDSTGFYKFENLPVTASYRLQFVAPAGYILTQANAGIDDDRDSDANPADGRTVTFSVVAENNFQWDVGFAPLGSIAGALFNDLDSDGTQDFNEPALGGWTVYLDGNTNGQLDAGESSSTTAADGSYRFGDLPASTYHVRIVLPGGWVQTSPGAGGASGVAQVYSAGAGVTSTGSSVEIVAPALVEGPPSNAPSTDLIQLDALRADPRFGSVDGRGYSVAIIDSGIDLNHPFFGVDADHNGIDDRIIAQYDFAGRDADASDHTGHGSHVAGIIGSSDAAYPGVSPGAGIIALKVFDDQGRGYFSYVEAALQWVLQNAATYNIAAVNMSLGDGHVWQQAVGLYGLSDELAALAALGVVVVSAAGNNYAQSGSQPGVMYPAADPNALAVGAVWDSNRGGPWSFGGYGTDYTTGPDRIASFSQRGPDVLDVFAPGAAVTSANATGGLTQRSGTSMATPYVTGAAVLAQQIALDHLGRRLTLAEFRELLRQTGQSIFDGDDEQTSVTASQLAYSRLDVYALAQAIWALDPNGPPIVDDPGQGDPGPDSPPTGQDGVPFTYTIDLAPGENRTTINFGATLSTVTNVPPQLELGADDTLDEGSIFTRACSFSDADPGDSWTATVDYGDGSGAQPLSLAADHSFTLSHLYTQRGSYTVTVVVTDAANESATDTIGLAVRNVAPTVVDRQYEVNEDGELSVDAPGVLLGALDPGQTSLSAVLATGPAHGVLELHADGSFQYTPAANYFGGDSFTFKGRDGQDDSQPGTITINVRAMADTPSVSGATTLKNVQTSSGLQVQRNPVDDAEVGYFKVTGITGGTLYMPNGTTQIHNGDFVAFGDANPRLRFTPALDSTAPGSFSIQASTVANDSGLAGSVVAATIIVNATAVAHTPSVTDAITAEDTQTVSGLEVTRNAADGPEVGYFKVTAISGGALFMPDGITQIHNGTFVAFDTAAPRLRFTPAADSLVAGKFTIQASTTPDNAGLGGSSVTATINVTPLGDTPSITNSTTKEDTQSSSGLVVKRSSVDDVEVGFFKVTGITGGTLFFPDGQTPITEGQFVPFALARERLKFTPAANSVVAGSFAIQASATASDAGLGGVPVTATITVTPVNDAPTLDASGAPFLDAIDQGSAANPGTSIADLLARAALGNPIGDVDAGALRGIAITAVNEAAGTWEYSINGGTNWQAVGTVSGSKSLLLAADSQSRLRLTSSAVTGLVTEAISFRAWDQTSGAVGSKVKTSTNGNDTAFSTDIETASIAVNPLSGAGFVLGYGLSKADEGRAVAVDVDGNTFVAATLGVADGAGPPSASGKGDIWIAKYNPLGALIWQQTLGGSKNDVARGMALDASGNLLITGAFSGTVDFNAGAGVANLVSAGGVDGFVLKLSGDGVFQWARRFGSSQSTIDVGNAVAIDPQNNVLLAGQFGGLADFDPAGVAPKLQSAGGVDAFVLKLDSSGQYVWARRIGGSGADRANALDVDSLGRAYVSGAFSGAADFDPGSATLSRKAVGKTDAFVVRLDSSGNLSYAATFGGTGADEGLGLAVDANFELISTGLFSGKADFDPGAATINLTSAGGSDVYVSTLDASGNYVGAFRFGGASDDRGRAVALSADGDIAVTGEFKGQADFDPGAATTTLTAAGSTDVFLAQYSPAGALLAANRFGAGGADGGAAVAVDADDNLYVVGSYSGKPAINVGGGAVALDSAGKSDVLVARVAPPPLGTWTIPAAPLMAGAAAGPSAMPAVNAAAETDSAFDDLELEEMAFALNLAADSSSASRARSRGKDARVAANDAFFAALGR